MKLSKTVLGLGAATLVAMPAVASLSYLRHLGCGAVSVGAGAGGVGQTHAIAGVCFTVTGSMSFSG